MSIRVRPYGEPGDFEKIGCFLIETYQPGNASGNWLQPRWEYMHYHPLLDEPTLNRIGVWEDEGNVIGVAHHEHQVGEVYLQIHPDCTYLKADMLRYAESYLYATLDGGRRYIRVFVNDFDAELESIARLRGYEKRNDIVEAESQFTITYPFPAISLPDGFRFKSFQEDNDLSKINRVLHRGFNHPGEPLEEDIEGRRKMQSTPNYRKDLNIVVEAPDGSFASYCGMWYEERNRIA